jgi:DNA-binding transcriptional LysR family regulator
MRIAEDGSLTRSASILRIAQPALSRQVRLLEEELGVTLFTRTARGMQLTETGEHLRNAIAGPLRELDMALHNTRSLGGSVAASFILGLPTSLSNALGISVINAIKHSFPTIKITLVEGVTGVLIDWLGRGIIDFAVLEEPSANDRFNEVAISSEPLCLIGRPSEKLPVSEFIALENALKLPLILPSHHMGVRGVVNDIAAQLPITLEVCFEIDANEVINALVAEGTGFSLLPKCYVTAEAIQQGVHSWTIQSGAPTLQICLATRKNSQISGRQFSEVSDLIAEKSRQVLAGLK